MFLHISCASGSFSNIADMFQLAELVAAQPHHRHPACLIQYNINTTSGTWKGTNHRQHTWSQSWSQQPTVIHTDNTWTAVWLQTGSNVIYISQIRRQSRESIIRSGTVRTCNLHWADIPQHSAEATQWPFQAKYSNNEWIRLCHGQQQRQVPDKRSRSHHYMVNTPPPANVFNINKQ